MSETNDSLFIFKSVIGSEQEKEKEWTSEEKRKKGGLAGRHGKAKKSKKSRVVVFFTFKGAVF